MVGKKIDVAIVPLWYTCPKLPPKTSKRNNDLFNSTTKSQMEEPTLEPLNKRSKISENDDSEYVDDEYDSEASEWEHVSEFESDDDYDESDLDWEY